MSAEAPVERSANALDQTTPTEAIDAELVRNPRRVRLALVLYGVLFSICASAYVGSNYRVDQSQVDGGRLQSISYSLAILDLHTPPFVRRSGGSPTRGSAV